MLGSFAIGPHICQPSQESVMSAIRRCVAVAFLILPITSGCMGGGTSEANRFADTINTSVKSWTADTMAFGRQIRLEKSPSRLRADLDRLTRKVRELEAKARTIAVPPGAEARELWSAYLVYITDQEGMVTRDFEELIGILGSPTPDMARFREILARCKQIEDADLERFHQAEAAYAKATGTAPVGKQP